MTKDDLSVRFDYHMPTPERALSMNEVRQNIKNLAKLLNEELPESREKALAFTKLEEVLFWAISSIARY